MERLKRHVERRAYVDVHQLGIACLHCKPKVGYFDSRSFEEDVLRLEVAMQKTLSHHVGAPSDNSLYDSECLFGMEGAFSGEVVIEGAIGAVLGDDHDFVSDFLFMEFEDVWVVESLEDGYFVVDEFLTQLVCVKVGVDDFDAERLALAAHRLENF